MNKANFLAAMIALLLLTALSCRKDDAIDVIPPRARGDEAIPSIAEIET